MTLNAVSIALAWPPWDEMHLLSRRPRVAVLGGGDEPVTPGDTPLADQVFDPMSLPWRRW